MKPWAGLLSNANMDTRTGLSGVHFGKIINANLGYVIKNIRI